VPVAVKQTPLIAQYLSVKQRVPDAILFFRLGDFYEMFFEDAEVGARVLDIQLTSRNKDGVPLCGVPYHSAEPYIAKLLKAGHKVAICEQGGPDAKSPKLMPRQIVRVMTPGTVGEELVLTAAEKSYLVAVTGVEGEGFALAALDVSTGEFIATQVREAAPLREEIGRIAPREIVFVVAEHGTELSEILKDLNCPVTSLDHESFSAERAMAAYSNRFAAAELHESIARAAGTALLYVETTFGRDLAHLEAPRLYRIAEYMLVDETTRRHLELIASTDGARKGSLLSVLDETLTAVGARTLANWITYPLLSLDEIRARHDAAEELFDADLGGRPAEALKRIGDLERLAGRIGAMRASPRDCLRLGDALGAVDLLKQAMGALKSRLIREQAARISPMPALVAQIGATLSDEPPINPRDGNLIRSGLNAEVDELRGLASGARGVIARLEAAERERTAIASLKVRYNNIFGYYIEVTKPNLERVPADYERKQTLVSAERFTTPALM
jgi:DNA mismatch repair protein MutS